jgi:predicted esterase
MCHSLPTSVALLAALSLTVVADDASTFEERVHRFTGGESKADRLKGIPIWTAHGDADRVVWPIRSQRMVEAIRKAGGKIKYTEYPGVGHNSWTPFYADKDGVVPWMFDCTLGPEWAARFAGPPVFPRLPIMKPD